MVAHIAGSDAGYVKFSELRRQNSGRAQRPYRTAGFSKLDALNQIQVDDRKDATPADLLAELREDGAQSAQESATHPRDCEAASAPLGLMFPFKMTWVQIGYLHIFLILLRDLWMHRLDISEPRAAPWKLPPSNDGRITALVVRDLNAGLPPSLQESGVIYRLIGPAGGSWQIGPGGNPAATLTMDALDFQTGRFRPARGGRGGGSVSRLSRGELYKVARQVLTNTSVMY